LCEKVIAFFSCVKPDLCKLTVCKDFDPRDAAEEDSKPGWPKLE